MTDKITEERLAVFLANAMKPGEISGAEANARIRTVLSTLNGAKP